MRHAWIFAVVIDLATACGSPELGQREPGGPDSPPGGGSGGDDIDRPDAAVCLEQTVEAESVVLPVDIVWVVDTSGSMSFEATTIETNLNAFAAQVDSWGIDYRVVMVAERGGGSNEVCVPPPLGGPGCTDGPRFRHVPLEVGSHEALEQLVAGYPLYQDFLRDGSAKQFVAVTDDEADDATDDAWFRAAVAGLAAPGFPPRAFAPEGYVFHSIVAWGDDPDNGCPTGANIGASYLSLTELTGGVKAKVCETDWAPIFAALQDAVMEGSQLPCAFALPSSVPGGALDPDQVNVVYTPGGGAATTLPRVPSAADCGPAGGWYYDDPATPSQIVMCPATCDLFAGDPSGRVDLQFGCTTVVL